MFYLNLKDQSELTFVSLGNPISDSFLEIVQTVFLLFDEMNKINQSTSKYRVILGKFTAFYKPQRPIFQISSQRTRNAKHCRDEVYALKF
jgi:hypothetical protein